MAIFIQKFSYMEAVHFGADLSPGQTGTKLSHPHQQERKPAQEHMGAYPIIFAVIDRAQRQRGFQRPESTFYLIELLVA